MSRSFLHHRTSPSTEPICRSCLHRFGEFREGGPAHQEGLLDWHQSGGPLVLGISSMVETLNTPALLPVTFSFPYAARLREGAQRVGARLTSQTAAMASRRRLNLRNSILQFFQPPACDRHFGGPLAQRPVQYRGQCPSRAVINALCLRRVTKRHPSRV